MKPKRVFKWLHLSDLHFRSGDQYDRNVVLQSLLLDIERIRAKEGFAADSVFLTGDLAFSGKPAEYENARAFLTQLQAKSGVPPERMVCVPGNHDVDRSRITRLLDRAARSFQDRDSVSEVIGNASELSLFTDRHKHYSDFVSQYFPWGKSVGPSCFGTTFNVVVNGIRLSILVLNSAWLAGADGEKGRIIIGERQVREALEKIDAPDVVVALLHHPLSYLADFDASSVRQLLEDRCDFILHGHVHEFGVVSVKSPDSEVFYTAAGAVYVSREETLAYNAVTLDLDTGNVEMLLRRYFDIRGGEWLPDTQLYRAAPNGKLTFQLPERLSHRPQPTDAAYVKKRLDIFQSEEIKTPRAPVAPPLNSKLPEVPGGLIEEIQKRKCILFAGAGASVDAKLPTWHDLLLQLLDRVRQVDALSEEEMKELTALLERGDWLIAAEFCRERLGKHDFAEYLRGALSDTNRSSRTHRLLANIPFRAAVTSNFDPFIEHSRKVVRVILPETMQKLGAPGVESILADPAIFPVVKIHGSYEDLDSIVLTHADFRDVLFKMPKYREFLSRLFTDSTLFFYGYGFKDSNVDFVLQELMALYGGATRPHYALMPNPGTIKRDYLRRGYNIRVIPYDVCNGSHLAAISFLEKLAATTTLPK